jgi:hypothetical protein
MKSQWRRTMHKIIGFYTQIHNSHSTEKTPVRSHPFTHWRITVPLLIALVACGTLFVLLEPGEPVQARVTTDVQGTIITHTTWTLAESPYVVRGDVIVNPDITLTIEPGVKVAFESKLALYVNGTLIAKGTTSQPIYFTTNLDSPSLDDYWGMIDFREQSESSVLQHTVIEYGGNATRMGDWCVSGALCVSTSSFTLDASTIQHNATRGLVLRQSDSVISNNTFTDHPNEAIRLHYCNHSIGPCRPSIIGNTFTENAYPIYRVDALDPYISYNQARDNDINGFVLKTPSKFTGLNTWYADDLTYVIETGHSYVGGNGDVSLTIQPGTVVKFGTAGGLKVFSDNYFTATITATGTTEQPIVFTSLKDDSAGGDTNNDSGASSPAVGDWDLLWLEGATTLGTFEHTEIRYARSGGVSGRPAFLVDYGATLMMKDSHLEYGEVGIKFFRPGYGANGQIDNTSISEMSTAGVLVESDGEILISNSRFEDNGVGVYISNGHPTVSDSFFNENTTGVEVNCTTLAGDCAPVISPHNSFPDKSQQSILNNYPVELCVGARYNWWGDKDGPQDASSALDACDLVDNPGVGTAVSDGVDYSPWDGGLARPLIARPGCGVTARNQPTFTGRAQNGAAVSFFDGDTLLGQTTADADDTFSWIPAEPLSDGEHTITAVASLGGETSLPSPELPMTVDSTLPFDPAGVLISYATHSAVHTQTLKDSSGCASVTGDWEAPLWIRPDSIMTVTVPIRTDLVPGVTTSVEFSATVQQKEELPEISTQLNGEVTFIITNHTAEVITNYYLAHKTQDAPLVYQPYTLGGDFKEFRPGDTRTINLPAGNEQVKLIFTTGNKMYDVVDELELTPDAGGSSSLTESDRAPLTLWNETGKKLDFIYVADINGYGGSFTDPNNPVPPNYGFDYKGPDGTKTIFLVDEKDTHYIRHVKLEQSIWEKFGYKQEIKLKETSPGVEFTFQNNSSEPVCDIYIYRYDDNNDNVLKERPFGLTEFFRFVFGSGLVDAGGKRIFKLEPGRYYMEAWNCDGFDKKIVEKRTSIQVRGDNYSWTIGTTCNTVGAVKNGGNEYPLTSSSKPQLNNTTDSFWEDFYAGFRAAAGAVSISICEGGTKMEVSAGTNLVDPDGYVYDATEGIAGVIPGATVICDMYDEDYQTWERWPAELYEAQINPQVTGSDGYYAFFVPSGLYRVRAVAGGYDSHTSPDIRVIDEIVHYNIPMTGGGGIFLPFVVR